jgi:hypothetical protein
VTVIVLSGFEPGEASPTRCGDDEACSAYLDVRRPVDEDERLRADVLLEPAAPVRRRAPPFGFEACRRSFEIDSTFFSACFSWRRFSPRSLAAFDSPSVLAMPTSSVYAAIS